MISSKIYSEENKSISNSFKITKKKIVAFFAILMLLMQYMVVPTYATVEQGYFTAEECPYNIEFVDVEPTIYSCVALDIDGNIWTWGNNRGTILGNGSTDTGLCIETPHRITNSVQFKYISATDNTAAAIDKNGDIWVWGSTNEGIEYTPKQITTGKAFEQISIGRKSFVAIDINGNIWTWGANYHGQLGNGTTEDSNIPQQITTGMKFLKVTICIDQDAVVAIDGNGNIWTWGVKIGHYYYGSSDTNLKPTQITTGNKFMDITSGSTAAAALDSDGNIWTWGKNYNGELAQGEINSKITEPTKITIETKFKDIAMGHETILAIDKEGNVWGSGFNGAGALGNGTTEYPYPNALEQSRTGIKFKKVLTSSQNSIGIDNENNIWIWGDNGRNILISNRNTRNRHNNRLFDCTSTINKSN